MIEWNNFYGAILIDRKYEDSKNYIINEMIKNEFNYFHPSIFSTGIQEYPFYYDNIIFSFGRTAKYFVDNELELQEFIKEFEVILNNLDFENAQIKIGATYANYDLFWLNKTKLKEDSNSLKVTLEYFKEFSVKYFETEKFYFGLGEIDINTGWIEEKYSENKLREFEMKYPNFKYSQ